MPIQFMGDLSQRCQIGDNRNMHAVTVAKPEPPPFWSALFTDRRIAPALGLGFTSGIPFLLVYTTQSAWLSDIGISIASIGLLSELTLAYKFKFLWAPFLDRYDPPLLGRSLGRRRGWIVVAQLGVMATLAGIAFGDPAPRLPCAVLVFVGPGVA